MFGEASRALNSDIDELLKVYGNNPTRAITRALVRAYAAYFEAAVFEMRQEALDMSRNKPWIFSPEEESVLIEKIVFLDKKGRIQSKDDFQRFLPLVLFSFRAYAHSCGATFEPDTSLHKWESFQHFIAFRNRLMHPRSISEIEFDWNDLTKLVEALSWFQDTVDSMLDSVQIANGL